MAAPDFYCKNFDPALVMNDLIDFSGREIELMHSKDVEVDEFPGSRSAFESTAALNGQIVAACPRLFD